LIVPNPQAAVALKAATASIPLVVVFDPVAIGLVQSLSHPGDNIAGLATYADRTPPKSFLPML
jgi:putative ABC transport system substrate-binding protein